MVIVSIDLAATLCGLFLAEEKARSVLYRLDPQTRAKVLATLAGLIILGFGMVALVWLGARVTRRYMNQGASFRRRPPDDDDWARKPLLPAERPRRERESEE